MYLQEEEHDYFNGRIDGWNSCQETVLSLLSKYKNDILDSRNPVVLLKEIEDKIKSEKFKYGEF